MCIILSYTGAFLLVGSRLVLYMVFCREHRLANGCLHSSVRQYYFVTGCGDSSCTIFSHCSCHTGSVFLSIVCRRIQSRNENSCPNKLASWKLSILLHVYFIDTMTGYSPRTTASCSVSICDGLYRFCVDF